jgi:hypothetical protein
MVYAELSSPRQNNFHLCTSDVAEYKGAFVLCDVTCIQAKIDLSLCLFSLGLMPATTTSVLHLAHPPKPKARAHCHNNHLKKGIA